MDKIDIDGTPFSVLLDRAVKIKSSQSAHLAQKYNALPNFVQSSLFPSDEVINARNLGSFTERFDAAMAWKEDGNAAYREGRFDVALEKYKMSLTLFRYVENSNPNIKNEGIKDEYLREIMYVPKNNDEEQQLHQFLVKLYNNLALTSLKRNDHRTAIQACDCAIKVDRQNDKSFYLRAQARIAPKSASAIDEELAMMDLRAAVTINPHNKQARKQLQEARLRIRSQRTLDKNAFAGLFNRGEVYDTNELDEEKDARRKCLENDRIKVKEESLKSRDQVVNKVDFRNPTEKMLASADAMGVDLSDPQTIEMLEQMQKEKNGGAEVCYDSIEEQQTISTAEIPNKYSSTRLFKLVRGATMLCVALIVYIRLLNSFVQYQMNA
eukprot:scaffold4522_cov145-Skeletonema_marinoi.AAC.6